MATLLDAAIFIGLSWTVWRALGRSIPIAVLPIIIGLLLAAGGAVPADWGIPSKGGDRIGWIGVMLLAFTAGLETRQTAHIPSSGDLPPARPNETWRFVFSAMLALLVPFIVGTLAAALWFSRLPGWTAPKGDGWLGAIAIGLCVAVSALPVLIGIIRELGPANRPLTGLALRIAVLDDAVLWAGLALLLLVAEGRSLAADGLSRPLLALVVLGLLVAVSAGAQRRSWVPPRWALYGLLLLFLVAGSWASTRLGLHALLGAYFAGAVVPASWGRRLPLERIGRFALIGIAPLFFGHSGLKIDGSVLGWASLQASVLLLVVSVTAKVAAVRIYPPTAWLSGREVLAVGALLQCKGLMEIVAATILRDKGLISEHAFAALVTLAVLSTLITGPAFRWIVRPPVENGDAARRSGSS